MARGERESGLRQGSPPPRLQTGTSLWFVRSRAAQQEMSGGQASEVSSIFAAVPQC